MALPGEPENGRRQRMKRLLKNLLTAIGGAAFLTVLVAWFLSTGGVPLKGGELADGDVVIVADHSTGPVATAAYLLRLSTGTRSRPRLSACATVDRKSSIWRSAIKARLRARILYHTLQWAADQR